MAAGNAAPRPTINGNNANVDSMLAKLNQRLGTLANRIGVPQPDATGKLQPGTPPTSDLLAVTKSHIDALQTAHNFLDGIEATFGSAMDNGG